MMSDAYFIYINLLNSSDQYHLRNIIQDLLNINAP